MKLFLFLLFFILNTVVYADTYYIEKDGKGDGLSKQNPSSNLTAVLSIITNDSDIFLGSGTFYIEGKEYDYVNRDAKVNLIGVGQSNTIILSSGDIYPIFLESVKEVNLCIEYLLINKIENSIISNKRNTYGVRAKNGDLHIINSIISNIFFFNDELESGIYLNIDNSILTTVVDLSGGYEGVGKIASINSSRIENCDFLSGNRVILVNSTVSNCYVNMRGCFEGEGNIILNTRFEKTTGLEIRDIDIVYPK